MTFESDENDKDEEAQPNPRGYEVGYGKPPAAYRFRKGQSGNPLGRPRKMKAFRKGGRPGPGAEPAKTYLLEEAYRPVLVREGEHAIELPAIQAVFRAMGVSAMKGNRFAQQTLAELVQAVEAENRQAQLDHFRSALDYKCNWEEAIERARELRQPEPQPIPHPDDIYLDFVNCTATVCGPLTKEQKADWDKALGFLDAVQEQISSSAASYKSARTPKKKADSLHWWKLQQKLFDRHNDSLPKRYRKLLKDRCWEDGASMPGEQSRHYWPNED